MLNSDKDLVTADPLNWMWQPWFIYWATLCSEPQSHLRLILSQTYLLTWSTQNSDFSWHSVVIIQEGEGRENTTRGSCFLKKFSSMAWSFYLSQSLSLVSGYKEEAISSHRLYSAIRRGKSPTCSLEANFKRGQNWLPSSGRLETPFLLGPTCPEDLAKAEDITTQAQARSHNALSYLFEHKPLCGYTCLLLVLLSCLELKLHMEDRKDKSNRASNPLVHFPRRANQEVPKSPPCSLQPLANLTEMPLE